MTKKSAKLRKVNSFNSLTFWAAMAALILIFFSLFSLKLNNKKIDFSGTYINTLTTADKKTKIVRLDLNKNKTAVITQSLKDKEDEKSVEVGKWDQKENSLLITLETGNNLEFDTNQKYLSLLEYDKNFWGSNKLSFTKVDGLLDTSWTLVESVESDNTVFKNDEQNSFKITVAKDLMVGISTDCNQGSSMLSINEGRTSFGPIASTRKYCPNSKESKFFNLLSRVESFKIEDDVLYLNLKLDAGVLKFSK